ncbi:conjugal transfer protein TraG N-terminal domain-containing protein, partial [Vibrio navarrensis]
MTFDIYIIGGGLKMVDFLNGIAMYASTNGIQITAGLGLAIGTAWMMGAAAIQKIKMTDLWSYMFLTMMFISVVINVKVDTYVYDPVNPKVWGRKVSNVPLGAAFITSFTTKIDYSVTKGVEAIFTTPNDLKYSQSGMLIGQDMIVKASRATIADQAFKTNLDSFVQNCVIYDIQMGHYSFNDVASASDMWDFFLTHANTKSRAFKYNGNYVTCYDGVQLLNGVWNGAFIDSAVMKFAKSMYPSYRESDAKAAVVSLLPVSYDAIVGVSDSAANLLRQNMMINMYYNAVGSFNMSSDSDTASQAYIDARTDLQTMNTNIISGQQNGKWLIYMKTTVLLILVGLFVLSAPFATLPGGFKKFVNVYFGLFFMICMWGPIFAFINYIYVSDAIAETTTLSGGTVNALTHSGITTVNSRISASAASFFGYVPYLSILLTGIGGGMASMLQSGLSASGRAAAAVANDVTMGTINLGTTSQGVHGYNNLSANKFDTSGSYKDSGLFTSTTNTGNQLTQFGNGSTAINTSNAYSKLESAGLFSKEALSKSLSQEGSRLIESGERTSKEFTEKQGSVISGGIQNSLNRYEQKGNGSNWNYGEDSRESQAARYLQNLSKKFADQFNVSEAEATGWIAKAFVGGEFNSKDAGFKGFGSGFNLKAGSSFEGSTSGSDTNTSVTQWVKDNLNSKEFNSSMETLFNASRGQTITENNGEGLDGRSTYGESADYAQTRIDSASADIRKGNSFRQASAEMANSGFDLSQNYQQAFVDFLKSPDGKGLSNAELDKLMSPENMGEVRYLARDFMKQESETLFKQWEEYQQKLDPNFKTPNSEKEVETTYNNSDVKEVDTNDFITQRYNDTKGAEGVGYDPSKAAKTKKQVNAGIDGSAEFIDDQRKTIETEQAQSPVNPTSNKVKTTPTTEGQPTAPNAGYSYHSAYTGKKVESASPSVTPPKPIGNGALPLPSTFTPQTNQPSFSLKDTVTGQPKPEAQPMTPPASGMPNFTSLVDFTRQSLSSQLAPVTSTPANTGFSLLVDRPEPQGAVNNSLPADTHSAPNNQPHEPFDLKARMAAISGSPTPQTTTEVPAQPGQSLASTHRQPQVEMPNNGVIPNNSNQVAPPSSSPEKNAQNTVVSEASANQSVSVVSSPQPEPERVVIQSQAPLTNVQAQATESVQQVHSNDMPSFSSFSGFGGNVASSSGNTGFSLLRDGGSNKPV